MRAFALTLIALTACTAPTAAPSTPTAPAATSVAPAPSETVAVAPTLPTATASAAPSATSPLAAPVSAGPAPEAGIVFFSDHGPPKQQLEQRITYRYDGATGSLTTLRSESFAVIGVTGVAHDGPAGVYVRGIQGRWDLFRWDGTRVSDQEFTACQVSSGYFASWCTVTPLGVGVGYGTHIGRPCGAPQFVRFPGDATGRPILAELCVGSAWPSDDGRVVLATGITATGPKSAGCPADQFDIEGTCYRRETWVIEAGKVPRTLRIPALPGFASGFVVSPDGRYAAAEHFGSLFLVDLGSGAATHLGTAASSPHWSKDGRLVFVRGRSHESWSDRTVVVATIDGATREILGYPFEGTKPIGLAPAWDPAGRRLAWVASRTSSPTVSAGAAAEYVAGRGIGERNVLVGDLSGEPAEVRCGDGLVAEGVRWSHDGSALLLLCRRPGARLNAYELRMHRLGGSGPAAPLVHGITMGGVDDSGRAPSLLNTGWSRGL